MKKVAYNKPKQSRIFSSALIGLAMTLVMSSRVAANPDQIASLQIPGMERSAKNIDLGALETKISNTDAINLFDKIKLKNGVDSLTNEFGQYHNGQSSISLGELTQRFEAFFRSTVAMLRKGDPSLAEELVMSRGKLLKILTEPQAELASPTTADP